MTTQVMFKIEESLKKAAQKRAREEGISLTDFYKSATRSFVAGKINVGLTIQGDGWEDYTPKSRMNFKKGMTHFNMGKLRRVR